MRCHWVCSFHSPDAWSFHLRVVASEKFVTEVPEGVNFVSASRPRLPTKITLLTDPIWLHCNTILCKLVGQAVSPVFSSRPRPPAEFPRLRPALRALWPA